MWKKIIVGILMFAFVRMLFKKYCWLYYSVILCDEIINVTDSVSTNVTITVPTNAMSTVSINSDYKKVRQKLNCYNSHFFISDHI